MNLPGRFVAGAHSEDSKVRSAIMEPNNYGMIIWGMLAVRPLSAGAVSMI